MVDGGAPGPTSGSVRNAERGDLEAMTGMVRVLGAVGVAMLLGACASLEPGDPFPGWSAPYSTAAPAARYCYRTLAEVDCHAQPLPGEANRQVGYFDAPVGY